MIKTIPARPTYIALEALGDIYAALTHVIIGLKSEGVTASPVLILEQIKAGGVADMLIHAPNALVYEGNAGLDASIDVSQPGKRDTLVLLPGSADEIIIYDRQGNQTSYRLRPNGMLKINGAITIRGSNYYVGDSETSDSGVTQKLLTTICPG